MQHIVNIDKSGRIVIPKEMREELGLTPDQPLSIEQTQGGLVLKPQTGGRMIERDGIWSYQPVSAQPFDAVDLIREMREERARDISGL